MTTKKKLCNKCGVWLPVAEFSKDKNAPGGICRICRQCREEYYHGKLSGEDDTIPGISVKRHNEKIEELHSDYQAQIEGYIRRELALKERIAVLTGKDPKYRGPGRPKKRG